MGATIHPSTVVDLMPQATAANRRLVPATLPAARFGEGSVVGAFCAIYAGVVIGEHCRLGDHVTIREGCRIGARCVIGTNADLQYDVELGDDVRVMNASHITGGTVIGAGTFIGPGVIMANDLTVDPGNYRFPEGGLTPPRIGREVMIGMGARIFPGVVIGDKARIAGGALVLRDVPAGGQALPDRRAIGAMTTRGDGAALVR
jgi:acetyltransferase-like isoleucine patch superfamily enzyme